MTTPTLRTSKIWDWWSTVRCPNDLVGGSYCTRTLQNIDESSWILRCMTWLLKSLARAHYIAVCHYIIRDVTECYPWYCFFPLAKGRSTSIPALWHGHRSSRRHSPFQCSCNPSIWHKVHRLLLRSWCKSKEKASSNCEWTKMNLPNLSIYRDFSMGSKLLDSIT